MGATTVRTLLDHRWDRAPDGTVEATVVADAFCHSMVRSLVGAVVPVGEGRLEADVPVEVLRGGVRDSRVRVMPPHGLSLEEVRYPPDDRARRARRGVPGATGAARLKDESCPRLPAGPDRGGAW